jgi:hypothetical protein
MDAAGPAAMHLAQLNVGRARYPLDDPRMAGFMQALDRVNAIAERSPGFVWRLVGDGNDATDLRLGGDQTDVMVNMSVWESAEALERFVWNTAHRRFYERKSEWFAPFGAPHFVMWPVPIGHRPGLAEAAERLARLTEHGPSDDAFGWEGLAQLRRWREARCA